MPEVSKASEGAGVKELAGGYVRRRWEHWGADWEFGFPTSLERKLAKWKWGYSSRLVA